MDRIKKHEAILLEFLKEYEAKTNPSYSNIRSELFVDKEKKTFIVLAFGWTTERFLHFVPFHFEIKPDGKIWLYENRTDISVVEELTERGINEEDIFLALVKSYKKEEDLVIA